MKIEKYRKYNKTDVEIISQHTVFQGYFRMEKFNLRFRLFNGKWSKNITREVFERGHAVVVLPYDPIRKKFILVEQFRVGALEDKISPWLLEPVAGIIDPGETYEQVAHRETKEESGLDILELTPICNYLVSPGGCTETVALFCARVDSSKAGGIHGLMSEQEDIKAHIFDVADIPELLSSGAANTSIAIISLQWLLLQEKK